MKKYHMRLIKKLPRLILLGLALTAITIQQKTTIPTPSNETQPAEAKLSEIQKIFPGASSMELEIAPDRLSSVLDSNDEVIGYFVESAPYSDKFHGYAGPVPLIVGFDLEQRIKGITLLPNNESKSFTAFLEKKDFFRRWNNHRVEELASLKIDAISGATMTSTAVIKGISARLSHLTDKSFPSNGAILSKKNVTAFLELGLIIFALLSMFKGKQFKKYRTILLVANVTILGFLAGHFISLSLGLGWLIHGVPLFNFPVLSLLVLGVITINTYFSKPFYCNYLCPYGSAQEIASKIVQKRIQLPHFLRSILKYSRKIYLGILTVLLICGCSFDLTEVEPFAAFLWMSASYLVMGMAIFFILLSLIIPKFWCRYLCPTGEILNIFTHNEKKGSLPSKPGKDPKPIESPNDRFKLS